MSGLTLCFQFVSASTSAVAATATAAMTFASHAKAVWARGLGKCTWWPFGDVDPRSKQKLACLHGKVRTTQPITAKLGSYISLIMLITRLLLGECCWKPYFCRISFENFGCVFSRSNTLLDISQEWLVRLMWNEKEVDWHWTKGTWVTHSWLWPMGNHGGVDGCTV